LPLVQEPAVRALNLQDPDVVRDILRAGAAANRQAPCRKGSIDLITAPGTLIATGDLHDNPLHLARLVRAAGMEGGEARQPDSETAKQGADQASMPGNGSSPPCLATSLSRSFASPTHLVLHELIHSDRLMNGMDFSYRALVRAAALKAEFPERVHTLLANHELSQVMGAGIVKDGVKVVQAFNEGVEYAFGDEATSVDEAIRDFIMSMPLALRCQCPPPHGDILCAHSLPSTAIMERFDPSVLSRDLTPQDYEPRRGAAHLMVWGRGYDAEQIEDLVERWGINLFILGHEKAENGVRFVPPCVVVLNSDHDRGVYLPIDLSNPPQPEEAAAQVVPLAG
jgi:hypothetical protein